MAAFKISSLATYLVHFIVLRACCMEDNKLRVIIKGNNNKLPRRESFIEVCLILLTNFRIVTYPHTNTVSLQESGTQREYHGSKLLKQLLNVF